MLDTNRPLTSRPRVVADANIPFLDELLGSDVQLTRLAPPDIDAAAVSNADALITRTRTRCDAALLEGSSCRFVATATIGTDHIDLDYCASRGIEVVSAPGCNAPAVAQYVLAAALRLLGGRPVAEVTLGIVGAGHVGSIVERWARGIGFNVLVCDPPRREAEGHPDDFVELGRIAAEADIITFHTPHTTTGPHPTHHLADGQFFAALRRRPVIINSARGPILDTPRLLDALHDRRVSAAVIDCWEGEPDINLTLLREAVYATPHIAGYSLEGKARASLMVAAALRRHFHLPPTSPIAPPANPPSLVTPAAPAIATPANTPRLVTSASPAIATPAAPPGFIIPADPPGFVTAEAILASYDPAIDTAALRAHPASFEHLRNTYPLRHELP